MRKSLLLFVVLGVFCSAAAKDNLKVKVVGSNDLRPVEYVDITVEYPDTVVSMKTDRKGRLSFTPSSFPLTVTARAYGMLDGIFGLMSMPSEPLRIEMDPDPAVSRPAGKRRVDWSTATPRRLSSTYVVLTSNSK